MNYYIQGNKEKADQIKAAFERLGYTTSGFNFKSDKGVYYTDRFCKSVDFVSNFAFVELIKTHPDYQELELPVEPNFKIGDWIACDADSFTLSIKSVRDVNYYFHQGESLPIKYIDEHYHLWSIADAKDGDVLALNGKPFIYSSHNYGKNYWYIDEWGQLRVNFSLVFEGNYVCPATKQERDLLFSKMREVGYEWDADKKELHKIKPHYNIANFKPFDKVLTRNYDTDTWAADWFSHYVDDEDGKAFITTCAYRNQCIPFNDDTKHLLGTTDMCDERFINW